jgi:hypothetical protein
MQDSRVKISGRKIRNSGQREQKRELSRAARNVKVVEAIDAPPRSETANDH